MPFVVVSAPWNVAAGVWEESVYSRDAAVSIGVGVGSKCMGKRRGHVLQGYFFGQTGLVAVLFIFTCAQGKKKSDDR